MKKIKLPDPDTHCWDDDLQPPRDVWSYSADLVRQIVEADRAQRGEPAHLCGHCGRHTVEKPWPVKTSQERKPLTAQELDALIERWVGGVELGDGDIVENEPQSSGPAWHDAPDQPGIWLCDEGDICYTWTAHSIEILDIKPEDDARWFGPIPEDTK